MDKAEFIAVEAKAVFAVSALLITPEEILY
jgi:hypothetical protein